MSWQKAILGHQTCAIAIFHLTLGRRNEGLWLMDDGLWLMDDGLWIIDVDRVGSCVSFTCEIRSFY